MVRSHFSCRPGVTGRPTLVRGRTNPIRPRAEALAGQMLRGGRSWPSERKLGAGARKAGNATEERLGGVGTDGSVLSSGVIEQKSQHRLHLPNPSWCSPALGASEACSAC